MVFFTKCILKHSTYCSLNFCSVANELPINQTFFVTNANNSQNLSSYIFVYLYDSQVVVVSDLDHVI